MWNRSGKWSCRREKGFSFPAKTKRASLSSEMGSAQQAEEPAGAKPRVARSVPGAAGLRENLLQVASAEYVHALQDRPLLTATATAFCCGM